MVLHVPFSQKSWENHSKSILLCVAYPIFPKSRKSLQLCETISKVLCTISRLVNTFVLRKFIKNSQKIFQLYLELMQKFEVQKLSAAQLLCKISPLVLLKTILKYSFLHAKNQSIYFKSHCMLLVTPVHSCAQIPAVWS